MTVTEWLNQNWPQWRRGINRPVVALIGKAWEAAVCSTRREMVEGAFSGPPQRPAEVEAARLKALINTPEIEQFLRAVHIEAVHQVERWGTAHDRAKRPADWLWLVGYLAGKALQASTSDNRDKALHHCISTAAALYNWHCAIKGVDVRTCPGRSDLAEMVDGTFPGEAAQEASHD